MVHRLFGRRPRHRNNGYEGAAFGFGAVLDATVDECEQRMILADSNILARVPLGAALAHDNVAGKTMLAAKKLDAQALAGRVAPVARRSARFFVCHLGLLVLSMVELSFVTKSSLNWRSRFGRGRSVGFRCLGLGRGFRLPLALGFCVLRRLLAVGQNLGDADQREFRPKASLSA